MLVFDLDMEPQVQESLQAAFYTCIKSPQLQQQFVGVTYPLAAAAVRAGGTQEQVRGRVTRLVQGLLCNISSAGA